MPVYTVGDTMRKASIQHIHLRKAIEEIREMGDEEISDELFERFISELKHSCLITAGDVKGDTINMMTAKTNHGDFGMLFTDMDEFTKAFPDYEVEAHENVFSEYIDLLIRSDLKGYVINLKSEGILIPRDMLELFECFPENVYDGTDSYTSEELKGLKDSIKNSELERFIENPENIGKYEELFDMISSSTILTLMLSPDDLSEYVENGVISMAKTGPLAFLYIDEVGGNYAAVFTSEDKIANITTPFNRYCQIVNLSQMTNFILNDDMDGIIINPNSDNILLTRDTLLEYSPYLEVTCNDPKLNSAILHMFPMEV